MLTGTSSHVHTKPSELFQIQRLSHCTVRRVAVVGRIKASVNDSSVLFFVPSCILHSLMNVWRRETSHIAAEVHLTKGGKVVDIFSNLLGLGLGPVTDQKKRPAQPEGRSRTGKY